MLIPVGPQSRPEFLADTIESALHFAVLPTRIVLLDNGHNGVAGSVAAAFPGTRVTESRGPTGKAGLLYLNTARALEYVLDTYDCRVILRLDDDALAIGHGGDVEAIQYFREHPEVAIVGSYRVSCKGEARDFGPPARRMHYLATVGALTQPAASRTVRSLLRQARRNDYRTGEHCLGAACFLNPGAIGAMRAMGNLVRPELIDAGLEDDHIFGLLAAASGFKSADFASGDLPMALAWRGLPWSPEELQSRGKKYTHSVRFWRDMNEAEVRARFRACRATQELAGGLPAA